MKILVTGRQGQVVQSLVERSASHPGSSIIAVGRPDLDLEHPEGIDALVSAARPDLIVSAAAYTAVDQAEDEPDKARAVNALGAEAVSAAAAAIGVPVIHISTDYVFSGEAARPYVESDPTGPQSVYGATKLEGERLVAAANPKHLIFRTAWVYSPFGKNFLKTMLRLAETRNEISVVADQWGNPTSALDIADAILHVANALNQTPNFSQYGIYHLAGTGDTNWSGFARHITSCARKYRGPSAQIKEIVSSEFPTKARRPANSRLSTEHFSRVFGWRAPNWEDSSASTVNRLVSLDV
ncbi:dTDP-4-dehydrorhamnose reductase [Rhizobium sp. BK181]|uniref:dTDP-4-dehydrorhamnose reductase n=1 Tax=Rhizobium sp. BK181 TaxID=2587072 RepID=UPI00161A9E27|nr:dTDP-4-dehydrorhamnose reductase [Rhizobium sp. BK181]MBB3315507.1 dTDP-4-dehydrorhamnose reductase [Rhizobium sp. BK181]